MSDRITLRDLENLIDEINGLLPNSPASLSGAYGGHRFNLNGRDVLRTGHIPKRDLYNRLCAFVQGLEAAQKAGGNFRWEKE
jgi:hypothetical protein